MPKRKPLAKMNHKAMDKARKVATERRTWRRMAAELESEATELTSAARLIRRRLSA